jgi:hypothetical protein
LIYFATSDNSIDKATRILFGVLDPVEHTWGGGGGARKPKSTKLSFRTQKSVRVCILPSANKRAEGRQKKYSSLEIPTEETTAQICQETTTGRRRKPKPKPRARTREREREREEEKGRTQEREKGGNGEKETLRVSPGASRAGTEPQPPWGVGIGGCHIW